MGNGTVTRENEPSAGDQLQALRERLDQVDGAIIEAIAERQQIVAAIGELKQSHNAPLRHYAREREVIELGMARARAAGVSERIAREILETLIHHSLGKQEHDQCMQSGHGEGRKALVIGGAGRMGDWMARYLDTVGYQVTISDHSLSDGPFEAVSDWESVLDQQHVVVVAVPLRPSNQILMRLAQLRPQALIFDIGSLKSPMQEGLAALHAAGCRVCSVHPMFGPNEVGLSGRQILFVDVGNASALADARALFAHTAADCVELSLDAHDEVMAWVLGLSHFVNIAFADAVAKSGQDVPLLKRISSSTFNAQLQVAGQVVSENPHLYYEIQQGNARTAEVIAHFQTSLAGLFTAIRDMDEDAFIDTMAHANQRLLQQVTDPQ